MVRAAQTAQPHKMNILPECFFQFATRVNVTQVTNRKPTLLKASGDDNSMFHLIYNYQSNPKDLIGLSHLRPYGQDAALQLIPPNLEEEANFAWDRNL